MDYYTKIVRNLFKYVINQSACAPSAHKQSHYVRKTLATMLRKTTTSNPLVRELDCEYRTAGLPVKSSPSEKGKVLIKREQCQMHLNIAEREGLRRSQSI